VKDELWNKTAIKDRSLLDGLKNNTVIEDGLFLGLDLVYDNSQEQ